MINLLFAPVYWNDKTSTAASIVEQAYLSPSLIATNVPCILNGTAATKPSWAEEPPLFHALALLAKTLGFANFYVKIVPLLATILLLIGSFLLLEKVQPIARQYRFASALLLTLTPFIYIHATKFLPDTLMAALIPWFFLSLFAKRHSMSLALATLAVTIKATAVFLLPFALLGYWLYTEKPRKIAPIFYYSSATLPMLAWLLFLRWSGTDNPFFGDSFNFSRHTGGGDFGLALTAAYWARFFTWVISRGVSIPIFLFFLAGLRDFSRKSREEKILCVTAAGILPYWIMVRGPQFSAPWYSFPFLVPILILGCGELFRRQNHYLQWGTLLLTAVISLPKVTLSTKQEETRSFKVADRPVMLSCRRQNL